MAEIGERYEIGPRFRDLQVEREYGVTVGDIVTIAARHETVQTWYMNRADGTRVPGHWTVDNDAGWFIKVEDVPAERFIVLFEDARHTLKAYMGGEDGAQNRGFRIFNGLDDLDHVIGTSAANAGGVQYHVIPLRAVAGILNGVLERYDETA
jgi:hypothetical protein